MSASMAAIQAAIDAQLATLPDFDLARISFANTVYVPEAGTPFLDAQIATITRRSLSVGELGAVEWDGIYEVKCNFPIGLGPADVSTQVDAVMALFPRGLGLPTTDGYLVRFETATPKPLLYSGAWATGIAQMPFFVLEVTA